ncbi:MAG: LPXTG cell wall anchor domain-containing protein [Bacilli bacterium]|nr:LPXTG cell wall anchor domain-containing protein [Bacilli bacterium]
MLRRILNFLVILVIIIAISSIFINLYNSGKKENNKFDTAKETIKKGASKAKDSVKKKTEELKKEKEKIIDGKKDTENNNETTNNNETKDLDDNDVETNDNTQVTGNEIAVGSTGTKENIFLTLTGGIIILSGAGLLIFKTNN